MEKLTYLEKRLLKEVIAPALRAEKPDYFMGRDTISQELNFVELLKAVKEFYKNNQPNDDEDHWNRILSDSKI